MSESLPPSSQKVADAARALGLETRIVVFDHPTRTAPEAAAAVGVEVVSIGCKSTKNIGIKSPPNIA